MKSELPPHFVVQIALTSMLKRASKGKGSDLKSELCQEEEGIVRILDGKCKVKGSAEKGIDPPHTLKGQNKGQNYTEKLHAQIRSVRLTELYIVQYSQYSQYSRVEYRSWSFSP